MCQVEFPCPTCPIEERGEEEGGREGEREREQDREAREERGGNEGKGVGAGGESARGESERAGRERQRAATICLTVDMYFDFRWGRESRKRSPQRWVSRSSCGEAAQKAILDRDSHWSPSTSKAR